MSNELCDTRVEGLGGVLASLPIRRIAEIVECTDDLQQRVASRLANAIVVVRQLTNELDRALFDVRQEVRASMGEDATDSVGSNLFLNADGAVNVEHLIDVNCEVFNIAVHRNGCRRCSPRRKACNCLCGRSYAKLFR